MFNRKRITLPAVCLRSLLLVFSGVSAVAAAPIDVVTEPGNYAASFPLGYYQPYGSTNNPGVGAVSWIQTAGFQDVTISATLWQVNQGQPPGTINFELVDAIGAGTSFAQNGIAEGSVSPAFNPTDTTLVTLPSLGPGTYYLVIDSQTANTSWSYGYPSGGTLAADPSVSFNGDYVSRGAGVNGSYTPGSGFIEAPIPFEFSVVAAGAAAVPEPSTGVLALTGVAAQLARRYRWI